LSVYAPVSKKQEASVSSVNHYNGTWVIDSLDVADRFERQG
jgi:hypothetical protein